MSTIFGKIIEGELASDKVFENEHLIVIKDINPVAPVHLLIIPKKEIVDLQSVQEEDLFLIQEVVKVAQKMAKEMGLENGYRLIVNNGRDSGQIVFHLHFHLIGGHRLGRMG